MLKHERDWFKNTFDVEQINSEGYRHIYVYQCPKCQIFITQGTYYLSRTGWPDDLVDFHRCPNCKRKSMDRKFKGFWKYGGQPIPKNLLTLKEIKALGAELRVDDYRLGEKKKRQ